MDERARAEATDSPGIREEGPTLPRALLATALVLGAALRISGLAHGLRHSPWEDERYFIENAVGMLERGDLDHRFYQYPGLFFYVLALPLAPLSHEARSGATGYVLGRAVAAGFGLLNVVLVYRLGVRLIGPAAGALGAFFEAVSPVAVAATHSVRPDSLLETCVLTTLLALTRLAPTSSSLTGPDLRAGIALGAALAVKFSGIFLVPSYLAARWCSGGSRLKGALVAGFGALGTFAVASPYTLLHAKASLQGMFEQVHYHYVPRTGSFAYLPMLWSYVLVWEKGLGVAGALLALCGLVLAVRAWRLWLPFLLLPAATALVLGTSHYHFDRHMVPSFPVIALLAALFSRALVRRFHFLGVACAALSALLPLGASLRYIGQMAETEPRDRIVDFIRARVPPGGLVLSTVSGLGFDRDRLDILEIPSLSKRNEVQVRGSDAVVLRETDDASLLDGIPEAFATDRLGKLDGLRVFLVPAHPAYVEVPLSRARLKASEGEGSLPLLKDGRLDTGWGTEGPQKRGDFVEVDLQAPAVLARVELKLGEHPERAGKKYELLVTSDGQAFYPVRTLPGRPPVEEQEILRHGASQVLLLERPRSVRGLRIVEAGASVHLWWIAELRLDALATEESFPSLQP